MVPPPPASRVVSSPLSWMLLKIVTLTSKVPNLPCSGHQQLSSTSPFPSTTTTREVMRKSCAVCIRLLFFFFFYTLALPYTAIKVITAIIWSRLSQLNYFNTVTCLLGTTITTSGTSVLTNKATPFLLCTCLTCISRSLPCSPTNCHWCGHFWFHLRFYLKMIWWHLKRVK